MNDLITWLRAQLDEEAEAAQALGDLFPAGTSWTRGRHQEVMGAAVAETSSHAEHIARWDPARVLAEVDANRKTLAHLEDFRIYVTSRVGHNPGMVRWVDGALRVRALPYAGRLGWREEWRA